MAEPVPVIPLGYAQPEPGPPPVWGRFARIVQGLALAWCVIAWILLTFVEVKSVIITGPVLGVMGALLVGFGVLGRRAGTVGVGAAHAGICLLFAGLVNLLNWSPDEAEAPFSVIGLLYVAAALVVAGRWAWRRRARIEAGNAGDYVT